MRNSILAALAASTLAAAQVNPGAQSYDFNISNFVFGCTAGCSYSFNLTISGSGPSHPAVSLPVVCSGNLDENTSYNECGYVSETQTLSAYIEKASNELKLEYEVRLLEDKAVYDYRGEKAVYAATSDNAALQSANFTVPETIVVASATS